VTRAALFAKAVAFNTTKDPRHLAGLHQGEIETVLSMASMLRDGHRQAAIMAELSRPSRAGLQVPPRHFNSAPRVLSPMEAERVRRAFWADKHAKPRTLP
jgi:hypothetical protein